MDVRKFAILKAVIDDYIATAEPVASGSVARRYSLGVSPATIRNEMACLEQAGFLEQPHTSAGRVPSDKGYRYYVDYLLELERIEESFREWIQAELLAHAEEISALAHRAARLLAHTTNCLILVYGPDKSRAYCHLVKILSLAGGRGTLVIATEDGLLHQVMAELREDAGEDDLRLASVMLTNHFRGRVLRDVEGCLAESRYDDKPLAAVLDRVIESVRVPPDEHDRPQVYIGGATNLLRQPEFRDVGKVGVLLGIIEEDQRLMRYIASLPEQLSVVIGAEARDIPIEECSLVSTSYRGGGSLSGKIVALGPRRMDYGSVISLVDEVSFLVSEILAR